MNMNYLDFINSATSGMVRAPSEDLPKARHRDHEVVAADRNQVAQGVHYDIFQIRSVSPLGWHGLTISSCTEFPGAAILPDLMQIRRKNAEYGGSWLRRGGSGAFHATARKPDRIEHQLQKYDGNLAKAIAADSRDEGILDDIGDLRRYLILWEAVWLANPDLIQT
jgi:hypothetical protein